MSKYIFYNKSDANTEVSFKSEAETSSELVNDIYYFLLGCSFSKTSILEAFSAVVEDYTDHNDNDA